MDDRLKRMKELAGVLSEASRAYYQESRELMSNLEYDRLYDELFEAGRRRLAQFLEALPRR